MHPHLQRRVHPFVTGGVSCVCFVGYALAWLAGLTVVVGICATI